MTRDGGRQPTLILHFFDWFSPRFPQVEVADAPDWDAIGLAGVERGSYAFYEKQFAFIRRIGIGALAWELHRNPDGSYTVPSRIALGALRDAGLLVCPFVDLELTVKVLRPETETMTATLTSDASIFPDAATVDLVAGHLDAFCAVVPPELCVRDAKDRSTVFVFGYGFSQDAHPASSFDAFASGLRTRAETVLERPVFYWTFKNSVFLEHLLLHHRDSFCGFHFVLDQPLAQFGSDAVTWNFGFDNDGAARRDGSERVIRNDLRYLEEMGWLAAATNPAVVFMNSWDEAFEGTMLLPSVAWNDSKARLARHLIERLRAGHTASAPPTLVIVNDPNDRPDDWHTAVTRQLIWYALRRLAPQSDLRTVEEAETIRLGAYRFVVDLSVRKSELLSARLKAMPAGTDLLFVHPLAGSEPCCLTDGFAEAPIEYRDLDCCGTVPGQAGGFEVKDDVKLFSPGPRCTVLAGVDLAGPDGEAFRGTPLLARVGHRVWLNAFNTDDHVLGLAFAALYGRGLQDTVMYGESYESQRLTVSADGRHSEMAHFARASINERWTLPEDLDLVRLPDGVDPALLRPLYGLDRG